MARRRKTGPCPCGSKTPHLRCCTRFIAGSEAPNTPAQLMRSRYAAYAFGDADYIISTTDPDGPVWESDDAAWRESVLEFSKSHDFLGVDVLSEDVEDDRGTVRFHARLRRGRENASFEETSEFVRRDGQWLYTTGVVAQSGVKQ